jgi:peptidoglycan/LPS O-acetylase OafA/YrhL
MKQRLSALDGLRGFAALSVMFSHLTLLPQSIIDSPLFAYFYAVLSAGANSVQILFVLSGFLMAALYPEIVNILSYYQKRYARVMPLFVVVASYLGLVMLFPTFFAWWLHPIVLIALASSAWLIGQGIHIAHERDIPLGKTLFFGFIALQIAVLATVIAIAPRMAVQDLPAPFHNLYYVFSNLTLTTSFGEKPQSLSGVFWSLAPEIIFYLLYPLIVIPLIKAGRAWGRWASLLLTFSVLKILFDLDHLFFSVLSLHGLQIARSAGFVVGVWAGTLYRLQSNTWQKLSSWLSHPLVNAALLAIFLFVQWADTGLKIYGQLPHRNLYYFFSSLVIGLVVIACATPKTLINRIFSSKWLVAAGLVSYSLYLTHYEVVKFFEGWLPVWGVKAALGERWYAIFLILVVSLVSLSLAALLFKLVESLYFYRPKTTSTKTAKITVQSIAAAPWKVALVCTAFMLGFLALYAGDASPSLLVSGHTVPHPTPWYQLNTSLLSKPFEFTLTARHNNLSSIEVALEYYKEAAKTAQNRPQPAELIFRLYDESGKQLFESRRAAYLVEGDPQFPFGFPTISDSKGKTYRVVLSLEHGVESDQVFAKKASLNVVSVYTTTKSLTPAYLLQQGMNRVVFAFSSPNFIFVLVFIAVSGLLVSRSESASSKSTATRS